MTNRAFLGIAVFVALVPAIAQGQSSRKSISLNGPWKLTAHGTTGDVEVPGTFEQQIAADFDGVGTYEREVEPFEIPEHHRLLIRFDGAATESLVWFNETQIGSHLGAWTPFKFDVTDLARAASNGPWWIKVQVDEKVGHNTQGFLPVIQPHFGGLWQGVRMEIVPEAWIDEDRLMAIGDWEIGKVSLRIPVGLTGPTVDCRVEVDMGMIPQSAVEWSGDNMPTTEKWFWLCTDDFKLVPKSLPGSEDSLNHWNDGAYSATIPIFFEKEQAWSPSQSRVFPLRIRLTGPATVDEIQIPIAFRSIKAQGKNWLLNGKPLMIRGVLNWGYAPPLTCPSLDEAWMRNEIEVAKSYGFNLMKFCLWVPPKRYLELCDELGMLAWVEYPTWHPQLTKKHLGPLRKEYSEFFAYDRNHPSVILRSLTCETGSGAELDVIQSLYDLCKQQIPGTIVEDDSSWIEWNRVSDFYDDHPYGNNHTWPATLKRLNDYIAEREVKPLILGEAIAADTWTSPQQLDQWSKTAEPFHRPGFLADNARWLARMQLDNDELSKASRHYAMLMRKYQIETYRRLVPEGGYVVSVIRDFPLAGMGLIDYAGAPKWTPEYWSFHGETMLLLETENDRRSFFSNEPIRLSVGTSHFGSTPINDGFLRVSLLVTADTEELFRDMKIVHRVSIDSGATAPVAAIEFAPIVVDSPKRIRLRAEFFSNDKSAKNEWPLWIFPAASDKVSLVVHPSMDHKLDHVKSIELVDWRDRRPEQVVCASQLDHELLEYVSGGGRLIMLPHGQSRSFPLEEQWFLRGGPAIFPLSRESFVVSPGNTIAEGLVELQHFDLAGPVVPNVDSMLDDITPILMLWDNHDRKETRTHGLMFEIPVGRGRILVSTLDYKRPTNAAGQWILAEAVKVLAADPEGAADVRGEKNLLRLQTELSRNEVELQSQDWKFQPDPNIEGEMNGWQATDFDDSNWKTIKADQHWEGQGHESLDNWAWYRLCVPIDDKWKKAEKVFLNFTGVDDHYRLFVNGQFVGESGDVATKKTAFDERKSYDISEQVKAGDSIQIAIAVYDWYGAGGIFRPVTLSTQPLSDDRPWLK